MRSILSLIFVAAISQILCAAQEKGESSSEVVLKEAHDLKPRVSKVVPLRGGHLSP